MIEKCNGTINDSVLYTLKLSHAFQNLKVYCVIFCYFLFSPTKVAVAKQQPVGWIWGTFESLPYMDRPFHSVRDLLTLLLCVLKLSPGQPCLPNMLGQQNPEAASCGLSILGCMAARKDSLPEGNTLSVLWKSFWAQFQYVQVSHLKSAVQKHSTS